MSEEFVIEVMRTGEQPDKGHVYGVMNVKNKDTNEVIQTFSTLEHGGTTTSLKTGWYDMKHSIKRTHRQIRCLRPVLDFISTILIHDAYYDDAKNLSGCIAPFLIGTEAAPHHNSETAMKKLWEALGGFDESQQKIVRLNVINNVPGDNRKQDNWFASRKIAWDAKYGVKK
jgi:hypothetical protein